MQCIRTATLATLLSVLPRPRPCAIGAEKSRMAPKNFRRWARGRAGKNTDTKRSPEFYPSCIMPRNVSAILIGWWRAPVKCTSNHCSYNTLSMYMFDKMAGVKREISNDLRFSWGFCKETSKTNYSDENYKSAEKDTAEPSCSEPKRDEITPAN